MADVFVEQIVKKKRTASDIIKNVLVVIAAFLVAATVLVIQITRLIFPFVFAMAVYFTYNFIRNSSIEYEYSVTNGELDVDSIAGRRKRRRILSASVRRFSILAPATEAYRAEFESASVRNIVEAHISPDSENLWFARFEDESGVDTVLFFNPNEKVLRAMAKLIPSKCREVPPEYLRRENEN